MFATLLGGLPRPPLRDDDEPTSNDLDVRIEVAIRAQEDAGLEPITDGRLRDPGFERLAAALGAHAADEPATPSGAGLAQAVAAPRSSSSGADSGAESITVDGWRLAAGLTDRAVKQALPGPYTLGRLAMDAPGRVSEPADWFMGTARGLERQRKPGRDRARDRERRTMAAAGALRIEVEALVAAGCPLIEIEELDAHLIGDDEAERRLFRDAHRRLTDGVEGTHLSLSIVGGSAAGAGLATILDAPYASLAVDLIAGPESWNLVAETPGDRGVIVGALGERESVDEPMEILLWGAHYAASTGGRGLNRVGLGSAGSYANLTWDAAVRKMRHLGAAARLALLPPSEELARALDPASVSARRAALGHDAARRSMR